MSEEPRKVGARMVERALAAAARVGIEDLDADEAAQLGVRTAGEHTEWRWSQAVPQRFVGARIEHLDQRECFADVADWSVHAAGRNLVIIGPTGVGKTHAAIAACRHAHTLGLGVTFMPAVEMFDQLRPDGPPDALERMLDADRLIIDDLGAERPSEWTAERLYLVVNRRWLDERPTIVTTNLEPKVLAVELGPRMFSRLVGSGAVVIRMTGPDLRRQTRGE